MVASLKTKDIPPGDEKFPLKPVVTVLWTQIFLEWVHQECVILLLLAWTCLCHPQPGLVQSSQLHGREEEEEN